MQNLTAQHDTNSMKLCGAKIWAAWTLTGAPLYSLYTYKGWTIEAGQRTYHFQAYKSKLQPPPMFSLTIEQLTLSYAHFRPFCIDTKEV